MSNNNDKVLIMMKIKNNINKQLRIIIINNKLK